MTLLTIDWETTIICPSIQAPPPVCMSYKIDNRKPGVLHARDPRMWRLLETALRDPSVKIIAHNAGGFEIPVMLAYAPSEQFRYLVWDKLKAGLFSCTMIREKLLRIALGDPTEDFGLNGCLAYHKTGIVLDKDSPWRLRYGTLWGVPVSQWPQEAVQYSLGDTAAYDLWMAQEARQKGALAGYLENEPAQVEAAVSLALSKCWGVRTDLEAARKLYADTVADIEKDKALLVREGLLVYDGKSREPKKSMLSARERITQAYQKLGKPVPRGDLTPAMQAKGMTVGQVRVDEEACLGAKDDVLAAFTRNGQAKTLLEKTKRLQKGLIQASYNVLVDTGRISCRIGEEPKPGEAYTSWGFQLHNMSRAPGVRECFVARGVFIDCDYEMAELFAWAQVCKWLFGFSDLMEVLKDPTKDPHVEMGAAIFGMKAADVYAMKKSKDKAVRDQYKLIRQCGKIGMFGCPGGLRAKTLVEYAHALYGLELTEERAEEIIAAWENRWREARMYLRWVEDQLAQSKDFYRLPNGRKVPVTTCKQFVSNRLRGRVAYTNLANSPFQGLSSDFFKAAIVRLMYLMYDDRLQSPIYDYRMALNVHDQVVIDTQTYPDDLDYVAHYIRDEFCGATKKFLPDLTARSQPAAMRRHSKDAGDPVYDKNGKLICWEDRVV